MHFCLLLFGVVACVALSGATPVNDRDRDLALDHHEIHKRQLEVINVASGLICEVGTPLLEEKLETVNLPSFSEGGVKISSIDVKRVDIGRCNVSFMGDVTNPRVRISLSNIYLEATGRYKKKVLWFASIKGKWEVKIRNGHLDVDATLELGLDLPRISITSITVNSCDDDFTDVSVRFYGSISAFIINLFRSKISRKLSDELEDKVCEVGVPFLENELPNNPGTSSMASTPSNNTPRIIGPNHERFGNDRHLP